MSAVFLPPCPMASIDEISTLGDEVDNEEQVEEPERETEGGREREESRIKNHPDRIGAICTNLGSASLARQFEPGFYEVRGGGESMWSTACQKPVEYTRKSSGVSFSFSFSF